MKRTLSPSQAVYGPMRFKTFAGALTAFFEEECPQLGGWRTRQTLVQHIERMVAEFFPPTSHLRQGQLRWTCVDRDDGPGYRKRITRSRLRSVTLDLASPEEIELLAEYGNRREILQRAVARLFLQAYEQGGCLTNAEVALLLKCSLPTVTRCIAVWEQGHQKLLPRRGTIHDLGPTLTHKVQIVSKLFLEGKSVEQVSQETSHSPEAIHRYVQAFKQVLLCRRKGLADRETAFATGLSPSLVAQYQTLIEEMAEHNTKLEELLALHSTEGP